MIRSLILSFFLLPSAVAAGPSTSVVKFKGHGAEVFATTDIDECKSTYILIYGSFESQREKNGASSTTFIEAIYEEYDNCANLLTATGSAFIDPAGFSSSFKTGASAEIEIDVEGETCVCLGDGTCDRECNFNRLFGLKAIVTWTPNGPPESYRFSYSSHSKYSSFRFSGNGLRVPATIELSFIRDDNVAIDMNDWNINGELFKFVSGEISKTKYS